MDQILVMINIILVFCHFLSNNNIIEVVHVLDYNYPQGCLPIELLQKACRELIFFFKGVQCE